MTGPRLGRGATASAVVALAALTGVVSTPVWVRAVGVGVLAGTAQVEVRGAVAAPAVPAAALVLAAAGVAVLLAGRVGRWLVVAAVAASGLMVAWSVAALLADPVPVARAAAADATGVDRVVGDVVVTAWPWVAAALSLVVLAMAVTLVRVARRWPEPTRRHEARGHPTAAPASPDALADWVALTRGDDPT